MAEDQVANEELTLRKFLETVPNNSLRAVKGQGRRIQKNYGEVFEVEIPEIMLHCDDPACNGYRYFVSSDELELSKNPRKFFLKYLCKNCGNTYKTYALWAHKQASVSEMHVYKYGEDPAFGAPIPDKLVKLLDKERDYFLKGQSAENQGLGIAAFAYYRRVLVNQKNKIFDEIIKVCKKLEIDSELVAALEDAKKETRFTQSVESIKPSLPHVLYIDGHNPLTLLHDAISDGLHDGTDEECLELATTIRVVLSELVEKISSVNAEKKELSAAIGSLLKRREAKAQK